MATQELVAREADRRKSDRRSRLDDPTPTPRRGESWTTHERSHTEVLLCETQAATDYALEATAHAIAAAQTLLNELRAARAASVAARRAAHLAAGQISGATT